MENQAALGWKHDWFGNLKLVWLKEPDIHVLEQVARCELHVSDKDPCSVAFLAEGAFNKVYTVQCSANARCIIRVPIPVHPQLKTLSEVATIEYVRRHTDVPVPRIISFDTSSQNELGFEWMIMDHVTGSKLDEQWRSMSWLKKELLVRKIASVLALLFEKRFEQLGNVYKIDNSHRTHDATAVRAIALRDEIFGFDDDFCLGKIVELPFFWGNNLNLEVDRGPFTNSKGWLHTTLCLYMMAVDDPVTIIPQTEDESESDDDPDPDHMPPVVKARIQRLMDLLPKIFPETESEEFVLHHHDLHQNNIFVGDNYELCSIIDWECLPTLPLWAACGIPKFLQTKLNRHLCPDPDKYMKDTLDDGTEEINSLYYEHLAEYDKTQLRAFFLEEMRRICPNWDSIYQSRKMKAVFGEVVAVLGDKSNSNIVDKWLNKMEEHGSAPGIGDMLHAYEQEFLDSQLASIKNKARRNEDASMPE